MHRMRIPRLVPVVAPVPELFHEPRRSIPDVHRHGIRFRLADESFRRVVGFVHPDRFWRFGEHDDNLGQDALRSKRDHQHEQKGRERRKTCIAFWHANQLRSLIGRQGLRQRLWVREADILASLLDIASVHATLGEKTLL